MDEKRKCPFHVGEKVFYEPGPYHGKVTPCDEIIPHQQYEIEKIVELDYLILKGVHIIGGGIHWECFKASREE